VPILLPDKKTRATLTRVTRVGVAKTGQVSKKGFVDQVEHWDGSMDANVHLRAMRLKVRPENGADLEAIMEFEAAVRAHELSLQTGDMILRAQTKKRVNRAKQRLIERQGG